MRALVDYPHISGNVSDMDHGVGNSMEGEKEDHGPDSLLPDTNQG